MAPVGPTIELHMSPVPSPLHVMHDFPVVQVEEPDGHGSKDGPPSDSADAALPQCHLLSLQRTQVFPDWPSHALVPGAGGASNAVPPQDERPSMTSMATSFMGRQSRSTTRRRHLTPRVIWRAKPISTRLRLRR